MKLLRREQYPEIPWKNGRGSARLIAVSPPGATFDEIDWQVSRPEIARDGPFSTFPGLDRQFMLVDGTGLTLRLRADPDGPAFEQSITKALEPFAFRAEWDVECLLHEGPVQVFNVMTRRGRIGARLEIVEASAGRPVAKAAGETLLVHVARGPVAAWGRWGKATLATDDSILVDEPGAAEIAIASADERAGRLVAVRLHVEHA